MGLLDSSAGLVFRISADASDFEKEVRGVDAAVGNLSTRMDSMAGLASVAAAGMAAFASAALTGATAIFNLSKSTSEYGSQIFDATQKTGLAAETISALKIAADQSGSSLEAVSGGLSKFAKLIGEANDGSDKALDKLTKLGVTSTDLDTALSQALATIAKYPAGVEQMTAAQAAFGKSGADLLPLIKSFDGDLPGLIEKFKKLGLTMSDESARASDEFGDTLDTLSAQAAATGRTFALVLMPDITRAMKVISGAMSENKNEAKFWGESLINAAQGASIAFGALTAIARSSLVTIDYVFGASISKAINWAGVLRQTILNIVPLIGVLTNLGNAFGTKSAGASMGGSFAGLATLPSLPDVSSAGGGKGGGGGSTGPDPAVEAERQRKAAVDAARRTVDDQLAVYKAGYAQRQAALETALEQGAIVETEKIRDTARIRVEAIMDEIRLTKELSRNELLNADEKAEILQKLKILEIELKTEKLKGSLEITKRVKEEIAEQERLHQIEHDRLVTLQRRIAADRQADRQKKLDEQKDQAESTTYRSGGFAGGLVASIGMMTDATLTARDKMAGALSSISASWSSFFDSVKQGIDNFVAGIGSMISNFILMGSTGPSQMRKLTAGIIAGIAAQAAILSIFELAKGFAALFFNPAEAAAHFQSAALFGSIAVGTGVAGRKLAGNLFSSESADGGGSGSGDGASAGNRPGLKFTETFNGFVTAQNAVLDKVTQRTNAVIAKLDQTIQNFNDNYIGSTADVVVRRGAAGAAGEIFDAHLSAVKDNGSRATELKRGMGDFGYT